MCYGPLCATSSYVLQSAMCYSPLCVTTRNVLQPAMCYSPLRVTARYVVQPAMCRSPPCVTARHVLQPVRTSEHFRKMQDSFASSRSAPHQEEAGRDTLHQERAGGTDYRQGAPVWALSLERQTFQLGEYSVVLCHTLLRLVLIG